MATSSGSEKNTGSADILGPHSQIELKSNREQFLAELFDRLWDRYRQRVSYVRTYEEVIRDSGATFVNDHIAFRTLALNQPYSGIARLSRVFESLGYVAAGCYHFHNKHLSAIHFQHSNPGLPKLFISELKTWELEEALRAPLIDGVALRESSVSDDILAQLFRLDESDSQKEELLDVTTNLFHQLPWETPDQKLVQSANEISQYAAWTLVHGWNVNHFTSLINSHEVESLNSIDKTIAALKAAGVPMKESIEGEVGSKLRQSATEAVTIDVDISNGGTATKMPWTYAYFELAERGEVTDPQTGKSIRFEGFLGPQATNLFEMTRVK